MHLLFCAHLLNIFLFFRCVRLRYFIHLKCLGVVWCVLSVTPAVFIPSYSNFVLNDCSQIEHVDPMFFAHLIIFLGVLNLDIITSTPPLESLHCLFVCNSNRFHTFIFKLCIMIVHTLKMCTDDAGPE